MTSDNDKRNEGTFSGNSVRSGWQRTLPSMPEKSPLQELGIVRPGMTGKEVYEASKTYWAEYYRTKGKVNRITTYHSRPLVAGCNCDGAGWYYLDVDPADYRYRVLQRCDSCNPAGSVLRESLKAFADDTFDAFDLDRPMSDYRSGNETIPVRFQRSALQRAYATLKEDDPTNGMSFYVWGNVGSGKSHLARAWALRYAEMGYNVMYRILPNLVDELRSSVKTNTVDALIDKLSYCDMLVLDDIGAEEDQSDWVRGRLLRIVDSRTNKKTVYTSNLDPQELYNRLDERLADRINQAQRLWLPLQSYRQVIRERGK